MTTKKFGYTEEMIQTKIITIVNKKQDSREI